MIAISSFRPLAKCSEDRRKQYISAHVSWEPCFSLIWYFNFTEPRMQGGNTLWNMGLPPWNQRPTIATMAKFASIGDEWTAIINADIVVDPRIKFLENALNKVKAQCAISRRFKSPLDREPMDWGLDFFCARPMVWQAVANQIPKEFTIGRVRFDTWLCSFFARRYPQNCFDLTPSKLIFHPLHEEREDQHIVDPNDFYLKNPAYPKLSLSL